VSKSFGAKKPSKFPFFVKNTIDVLSVLTFSTILPNQFLTQITDGTEKFPTDENNYIIGTALHKTIAVPQLIQQTIPHHILE
jgi:hypothetical protein